MLNLNPEVIESTVPQEEVSPLPSDKVKQLFRSVKDRVSLTRRIPRVTYRLQLNHQFSFSRAKAVVAYLKDLGISDVYISPIFKAKKGSVHGYDILSPNLLNPEIGTEEDFQAWLGELRSNGLGQILDIVPNHMSIMGSDNIWWQDILENGPGSIYADFFDINWNPLKSELKNKVLLAILGDQYGRILENQELTLQLQEGSFAVFYNELKLPLDPKSYTRILKFRLPELEEKLDREDPDLNELFSIITALDHLPSQTETSGETVQERRREKEIIKKRIMNLYSESPPIRDFLDENVALFNGRKGMPESFNS
ncbi:MAG TPA: alpha-amylase family glycosyl hydrolase, partial [Thermodesulfobacteriota bacterium]|nr:alpha-amylase family glycosyl hydrolase [Thermodesulfobacteriota bacterium]